MSKQQKIYVLLNDGISLKNFGYSGFYKKGLSMGHEVVFWNATDIDLNAFGYKQNKLQNIKPGRYSELLKAALIRIELDLYENRFNDPIYQKYKFPLSYKSIKQTVKSCLISLIKGYYNSEKGAVKLRSKIIKQARKTDYYKHCKAQLLQEKPDIIFATSQRALTAIAPLTAAQDLGIKTAVFIYSWDNIPKATTMVTADYYFVWSVHMKIELLKYQPYILSDQVKVTGTPQFENHFDPTLLESKEDFFNINNLDVSKTYICFSGDDVTTSPKDPLYLRDLAKGVTQLNDQGRQLGIIFRRCPVDFSNRYDAIIKEYASIITPIAPSWNKRGDAWNTVFPNKEDLKIQTNIIYHTEAVVNLGSSMVFDYAAHNKPCAFMNYHYRDNEDDFKEGVHVYDFVHFRSMPSKQAVVWLSHPQHIATDLRAMLNDSKPTLSYTKKWFEIINLHPVHNASTRIWEQLLNI